MAEIKTYGSISIVDSTDGGQLSVTIQSNQPLMVIHDPNNTNGYTPDWSKTNLKLTPMIYFSYAGTSKQLNASESGVSITWKRKEGSGESANLIIGESVSGGVLTVSNNFLSTISSGLLTYIVTIEYTNPDTNIPVETQSQMTFALVKNADELKYCNITGESVFLYNSEGTLVGANTITLTANLTNVSVSQWQYKNSAGNFVAMTTTNNPNINGQTIVINANENVLFNNDVATIKLVTSEPSVYDIHTITKIRDGAAGKDVYSVVMSNESHTLPCDAQGDVTSYIGASTEITIYMGGVDDTENWNISAVPSSGVQGTFSNNIYTVTSLTVDAGYVEFTCTKEGTNTIKKRFSLLKQKQGASGQDAVIYEVEPSTLTMSLNKSNAYNPTSVTFNAYTKTGAELTKSLYSGRFKIYESSDGESFGTAKYTSGSNENTKAYTPSTTNLRAIKVELYAAGATSTLLDSQTVSIIKDGADGSDGADGDGGTSVILGNEAEVFPCTTAGATKAATDVNIPFYGYKGIQRVPITCTVGTLPSGVTVKSNTAGTASAGGLLIITVPAENTLGGSSILKGNFTLTFTCNGSTVEKKFNWSKSIQSENSILLQIFAPQGDVIVNNSNNVVLETQLTDGSTIVNSGITYQWAKFTEGSYQNITSGGTGKTLTVTPDMVESFASFRCTATYNGHNYIAYWCVTDKTDPVTLIVMSSIGDKLTSDTVAGAIYCIAYQNGEEIDPLKSTVFATSAPSGAQSGDYYYHLDKSQKTATLKKYNGSAWENAPSSDNPKGTYNYYRRNSSGVELDTTEPWKTGKVIYIDRSLIDGALVINVEADIPV